MSGIGAAPRAAVPASNARTEASRKNGAKSRGPNTVEGRARSAQNALKHGMRAARHIVLTDESAVEFHGWRRRSSRSWLPWGRSRRGSRVASRSPAGAAAGPTGWPPERGWGPVPQPGGQQADLFQEGAYGDAGAGLALVRDGNGTRSFETLVRYRGAAMAEFWRALRTLKALQAERQALADATASACARVQRHRSAARSQIPPGPRTERTRAPAASAHPSAHSSTSCPTGPGSAGHCTTPRRAGRRTNPKRRGRARSAKGA